MNKSKTYLAPILLSSIDILPFQLIENTYILSDFRPLEPIIYVVIKKDTEIIDEHFLEALYQYPAVEDIFDIGSSYLLVTTLDPEYHYEYLCFKRGNYSWYRPEVKNEIIHYLKNHVNRTSLGVVDKIRAIFARDPMLKMYYENTLDIKLTDDDELSSRMNDLKETFHSIKCEQFKQVKRGVIA